MEASELIKLHKENKELRNEIHALKKRINRMIVKFKELQDKCNLLNQSSKTGNRSDVSDFLKGLLKRDG